MGRGWGERDKNAVTLTPLFEEGETPLLVTKVYLHACYYHISVFIAMLRNCITNSIRPNKFEHVLK